MKTPKFLTAVAIVFAALSFGFKASAQTMAPVTLQFQYEYDASFNWEVLLHNVDTNEDYDFFQADADELPYWGYVMGEVPEGNYSTYLASLEPTNYYYINTWTIDTNGGHMEGHHEYMSWQYLELLTDWDYVNHPNDALYVDSNGMTINVLL